jgi:ubiquitin C
MTLVFNPSTCNINSNDPLNTTLYDCYNSEENLDLSSVLVRVINSYNEQQNKDSNSLFFNLKYFKKYELDDDVTVRKEKCTSKTKLYYDEHEKTLFRCEQIAAYDIQKGLSDEKKSVLKQYNFKDIFQCEKTKFELTTNQPGLVRVFCCGTSKLIHKTYYNIYFKSEIVQQFNLDLYPYDIELTDINNNILVAKSEKEWKEIREVYVRRAVTEIVEEKEHILSTQGCIQIQDSELTVLRLFVKYDQSVAELKNEISKCTGISVANQKLTYLGRELQDLCLLKDYKIYDKRTIQISSIIHRFSKEYQIYYLKGSVTIQFLNGKTRTYDVKFDQLVTMLKEQIQNDDKIPTDQQRLIFNGKQLEDGRTLRDYAIFHDSVVHVVLRLRGGMHHETSSRKGEAQTDIYLIFNNDRCLKLKVKLDKPVIELKHKIFRKLGIPCERQMITTFGKVLQNHKTCRKYNLHIGSRHSYLKIVTPNEIKEYDASRKVKPTKLTLYSFNSESNETIILTMPKGVHKCQEILDLLSKTEKQ